MDLIGLGGLKQILPKRTLRNTKIPEGHNTFPNLCALCELCGSN